MAHSKHVEPPKLPAYIATSPYSTTVRFTVCSSVCSRDFMDWLDNGLTVTLPSPKNYPYNLVIHMLRVEDVRGKRHVTLIADIPCDFKTLPVIKYGLGQKFGEPKAVKSIDMVATPYGRR